LVCAVSIRPADANAVNSSSRFIIVVGFCVGKGNKKNGNACIIREELLLLSAKTMKGYKTKALKTKGKKY
jgi:hypothetical protein